MDAPLHVLQPGRPRNLLRDSGEQRMAKLHDVFSVEFDLNAAVSEFVRGLSISPHSRVFLFTPDQVLLAHPDIKNMQGTGVKGKGAC